MVVNIRVDYVYESIVIVILLLCLIVHNAFSCKWKNGFNYLTVFQDRRLAVAISYVLTSLLLCHEHVIDVSVALVLNHMCDEPIRGWFVRNTVRGSIRR
jgi:hypothetical protein